MRVLELFSGLGGWRLALGDRGAVQAAYDVSEAANATYALTNNVCQAPTSIRNPRLMKISMTLDLK